MKTKSLGALIATVAVVSVTGCGGGGGGGSGSAVSPTPVTTAPAPAASPAPTPTPSPAPSPATQNPDLVVAVSSATYATGTTEKGAYDVLNAARSGCGFGLLQQDSRLDMASFNHAHYLVQNSLDVSKATTYIGHFEDKTFAFFTGVAPTDRATAANYPLFAGSATSVLENYTSNAAFFTTNFPAQYVASEALGAGKQRELMESIYHARGSFWAGRSVGFGTEIGFGPSPQAGYNQTQFRVVEEISNDANLQKLGTNNVASYPCQGATGVSGVFYPAIEIPNPFPAVTSTTVAYGTPIYFKADAGSTLVVTTATVTKSDGTAVALAPPITSTTDVNKEVTANEVFFVPTAALAKASTYKVHAAGTTNGVAFTKNFSFVTAP